MKQFRVSSGQSLVLLAFMILVLIAFAGLSIDTAKAFSQQRKIQAAANSGAVAGMNDVLLNSSDGEVLATINAQMTNNGVATFERRNVGQGWGTNSNTVYFTAEYLNANGEYLGDIGTAPASVPADRGAAHVRITTSVQVENTFAKVVGVPSFGVGANGAAGTGPCVNGVYPITFDKIYLQDNLPHWYKPIPMVNPYAEASTIKPIQTAPGTVNQSPRFRVGRNPSQTGSSGNFAWTRWNGDAGSGTAAQLAASMTGSGNLAVSFSEKNPPPATDAIPLLNRTLEVGDWIAADTGNVATITPILNAHITQKTIVILPVHDVVGGTGNNAAYHVERFAKVRLLGYSFTTNYKYFEFGLVQDRAFCSTPEAPPPDVPPTTNPFKITLQEKLQYYVPPSGTSSWDIAMIVDFSRSMNWCWATENDCSPTRQDRRIDIAARVVRSFAHEMLTVRNANGLQDNHVALVTYGHVVGGKYTAKLRVPFGANLQQMRDGFAALFGTIAQPVVINQAAELTGFTPTGLGLAQGVQLLANPRTVDANGRPVRLGVLLLTDGLTNVFADSNKAGYPNDNASGRSFGCQNSNDEMNDPFFQATCPAPSGTRPKPPIKGMIAIADAARAANPGMTFFAVVVGNQNGLTAIDFQLNMVAPDHYYLANSPADLEGLIDAIENELADPCQPAVDPLRPAVGAQVTIAHQEGGTVGTFTTNADGSIVTNVAEGTYVISARHTGVFSPNDPLLIPRTYTKLVTQASSAPAPSITVDMPNTAYTAPGATLVIDNPANAACPQ